jgi:hypothetical protein
MTVQTGVTEAASAPPAARPSRPRSTASATAIACETVVQTVALTLTPAAVACSIATMPAFVAGNLTCMFGARPANRRPCSSMRPVFG